MQNTLKGKLSTQVHLIKIVRHCTTAFNGGNYQILDYINKITNIHINSNNHGIFCTSNTFGTWRFPTHGYT